MPTFTKHYGLAMFSAGEVFSATYDRQRFTIIDNEMSFIAAQVGDGVVGGWAITGSGTQANVSFGTGIIGGYVTYTYGGQSVDLVDNSLNYLWMQRNVGIIGAEGPFSPVGLLTYSNSTPPTTPTDAPVGTSTFSSISLRWTVYSAVNFDHYDVYKSTDDGVTFTKIASPTVASYVDFLVLSSTSYQYKYVIVDINDLVSGFSPVLTISTTLDTTIPPDPINLDVIAGNGQLEVLWDTPPVSTIVAGYVVREQELDNNGNTVGSYIDQNFSTTTLCCFLSGLTNGTRYQVTVFSKTTSGILSPGVQLYGTPAFNNGPATVTNVSVNPYPVDTSYNMAIDVNWDEPDDAYLSPPAYYLVTLESGNDPGVASIYTETSVTITQYTVTQGSQQVVRNVAQNTSYQLTIQTVDVSGNTDAGAVIRFRIPQFSPPDSPTNLVVNASYSATAAMVNVSWVNSDSQFSYNLLTINKVNLNPLDLSYTSVYIVDSLNVGISTLFSVPTSEISNLARYDVTIIAVDADGNQSAPTFVSTALLVVIGNNDSSGSGQIIAGGADRPGVPTYQEALPGNSQVIVRWSNYDSPLVAYYNIYRTVFANQLTSSDFVKVGTVPVETFRWTDYDVVNDTTYAYFITVTNTQGLESLNPSDQYISYVFSLATPHNYSDLTIAEQITAVASGFNAVLTWNQDTDNFDGLEIYRSIGNQYSFQRIGDVPYDATTFTDADVLTIDGSYYYIARKYQNEANLITTTENYAPINAIPLGTVMMVNGSITTIDSSSRTDLQGLHDPVLRETQRQLSLPHTEYVSQSDDRRIRLGDNLLVTDWTTADYINYTTSVNISDTSTYFVFLNGVQTTINTYIDISAGQLTFDTAVYNGNGTAPIVSVIFLNTGETTGTLSSDDIESLSGAVFTKGKFDQERLPSIDHMGRFREPCYPVFNVLSYIDGFQYTGQPTTSVTFYDVLISGNNVIAATSNGLCQYDGTSWTVLFQSTSAAHRLYYSSHYGWYLAAFRNVVYYSTDTVTWLSIQGMNAVNIIRDFCEDASGNIFVSADSGVYVLNPSQYVEMLWRQTSPLNERTTDAYALMFDSGTLFASGDDGIYESTDAGTTWTKTLDTNIDVPVFSLINVSGTYFGASATNIWRKLTAVTDYQIIFSNVNTNRQVLYFADTLFLTTDSGILKSQDNSDIINDTQVQFLPAFTNLNRNGIFPVITRMSLQDNRLYLCSDNELDSSDTTGTIFSNISLSGPCPTFDVNGTSRSVGVFYAANNVFFDEMLSPSDIVSMATNYNIVNATNGGWVSVNYTAQVFVHLDGQPWATGKPSTLIAAITPVIENITLTSFSPRTANYDAANSTLTQIVQLSNQIDTQSAGTTVSPSSVSQIFQLIDRFNTYLDPSIRQNIAFPALGGNLLTIPPTEVDSETVYSIDPSTLTNAIGTFDSIAGQVNITTPTIDKYDVVELTILGVGLTSNGVLTHAALDDVFDTNNSGLPTTFGFVQQSNLLKLLAESQRLGNPAEILSGNTFLPTDGFYDTFASTIDYNLALEQLPLDSGLFYPAAVLAVNSEVWVCGLGNIIAIDQNTYATREVFSGEFYIYDMSIDDTTVYVVAEDGLYQIDTTTEEITKNTDIDLPPGFNSILSFNNSYLVGTPTGVFSQHNFDVTWQPVVTVNNAVIHNSGNSTFSFITGTAPADPSSSIVYYSTSGGNSWNMSSTFDGILVNSMTMQGNTIYYATNAGLYSQDLSQLYGDLGGGLTIQLVDVLNDPTASAMLNINDVNADSNSIVAVDSDGNFYLVNENPIIQTQSQLSTIHKVLLVGGNYWLFGHDLIQIEGAPNVVQLSSGVALL